MNPRPPTHTNPLPHNGNRLRARRCARGIRTPNLLIRIDSARPGRSAAVRRRRSAPLPLSVAVRGVHPNLRVWLPLQIRESRGGVRQTPTVEPWPSPDESIMKQPRRGGSAGGVLAIIVVVLVGLIAGFLLLVRLLGDA
jgi:hypothetical protein